MAELAKWGHQPVPGQNERGSADMGLMVPAERYPPITARVIPLFDGGSASTDRRAHPRPSVAVLLPCRNEATTIAKVIGDFQRSLPDAAVYVYDNASTDGTAEAAAAAGAIVRSVPEPGKGNVLRRMFAEIEASVYVVADGDDTYDSMAAPALVHHLIEAHLDMVVATRQEDGEATQAYRPGHRGGNKLLTLSVRWLFGAGSTDMLSGYRVFSRRYVKSFPAVSNGFETETEMTVHALDLSLPFHEVATTYGDRAGGSSSKLRTIPDGLKILAFILKLCKNHRPWLFFGPLAFACWGGVAAAALIAGPPRALTAGALAAVALTLLGMVFLLGAIILGSLGRSRRDVQRMLYLAVDVNSADTSEPSSDRRAVPRGT